MFALGNMVVKYREKECISIVSEVVTRYVRYFKHIGLIVLRNADVSDSSCQSPPCGRLLNYFDG